MDIQKTQRIERRQAQLRVVLVSYGLMDKLQLSSWHDKIWYEVFKYSTKCLCSNNMCHPNGCQQILVCKLEVRLGWRWRNVSFRCRSGDFSWMMNPTVVSTKTQSCLKVFVFYLVATQLFFIFTPDPWGRYSNLTSIFFRWVVSTPTSFFFFFFGDSEKLLPHFVVWNFWNRYTPEVKHSHSLTLFMWPVFLVQDVVLRLKTEPHGQHWTPFVRLCSQNFPLVEKAAWGSQKLLPHPDTCRRLNRVALDCEL